MIVPIDPSKPMQTNFNALFAELPDSVIAQLYEFFPQARQNIVPDATVIVLEELWLRELIGVSIRTDEALHHFLNEQVPTILKQFNSPGESVDLFRLKRDWHRYVAAAQELMTAHPRFTFRVASKFHHKQLNLVFDSIANVDEINIVSAFRCSRGAHGVLQELVAAQFDTRERIFLHELVAHGEKTDTMIESERGHKAQMEFRWVIAYHLATHANVRISGLTIAFDLEWNPVDTKDLFTKGMIVDAHYEDVETGWVIFSSLLKVPHETRLSAFLSRHNYDIKTLNERGEDLESLRLKLCQLHAVCHELIFTAYGGVNSDNHVLFRNRIFMENYIDATIFLNASRSISLGKLYLEEFGENFQQHNAASDTKSLLRLIRHRHIGHKQIWSLFSSLRELGTCQHIPIK